jgi:AraC family transcriptional regulator
MAFFPIRGDCRIPCPSVKVFFMGSVRRYGRTANFPPRAPTRSRLLREVELTPVRRGVRLGAARDFEAAGIAIQHVPIDAGDGFKYQWVGYSHYLALHDLRLADGELFTDGSVVERRKDLRGMMTFAPAGCRLWGWSIPRSGGQSFTALYLNPRKTEEEVAQKLRHIPSQANVYFANSALRSTLEKMQLALAGLTPADSMYLESLCLVAVLELCVVQKESLVAAAQPAGKLAQYHEKRIAEYIETNLGKDISLNDLAQLAGLSRFHFLRAFKKTTEETPYQYLLRRRIARAQTLLRKGNMSITEIASAVGFKDSTRFIRAFRKMVGVTPGAYQQ